MKNKITIHWLSDIYECDTCGDSYADGAKVYKDGDLILDLEPSAHCSHGVTYTEEEVYNKIFTHLGYSIETDYLFNCKN